jgi:ubiquinone/menaquinone biosynthesis C-methylase UbiE
MTLPKESRVDYDRIAHLYDERVRDHGVDAELVALLASGIRGHPGHARILDIGCGTGKQLAANRGRFPAMTMVGVDRSEAMLRIARARCTDVHWIRADGAALPLGDGSVDYATSQYSYQHVRRTPQLLGEVFRALRPGGRFLMVNIDPWSMPGWLVYHYFPAAVALDRRDFVPADEFVALMRGLGFADIRVRRDDLSKQERLRDFQVHVSGRHRGSQLMAIPDADYAAGLAQIRRDLDDDADRVTASQFVLITIVGDKP